MLGLQSARGSVATPTIAVPFISESWNTNQEINNLRDGGDDSTGSADSIIDNIKMMHKEEFSFSCYAKPDISYYLSAYFMGWESITTTSGACIHDIHKGGESERRWLTIERKLNTTFVQRLVDCKIEELSFSGESGQPVRIDIAGNGLSTQIRTTDLSPSYESGNPFMFYDGNGTFKIDGNISSHLKSFNVRFNINSGGGLKDDTYKLVDLPDFSYSIDANLESVTSSFTRFKQINYNTSTVMQDEFATGTVLIDLRMTTTRRLIIGLENFLYQSCGMNLNPGGGTLSETFAGIVVRTTSSPLYGYIQCYNSVNEAGIEDNGDPFIADNDDRVIIGVH